MTATAPFQNAHAIKGYPASPVKKVKAQDFLESIIDFDDGARWKLDNALTEIRYQQVEPPFEARQVFEAVCVQDREKKNHGITQAIVKVKYQIVADEANASTESERQHAREFLQSNLERKYMATHLVEIPHVYTINEIQALQNLRDTNCAHTSWLLGAVGTRQPAGSDQESMADGFAIFILMTKVIGTPIAGALMRGKDIRGREEVRASFKKALVYIVDFENYVVVNINPDTRWVDDIDRDWDIDENRF